jgi:hypothetical protein
LLLKTTAVETDKVEISAQSRDREHEKSGCSFQISACGIIITTTTTTAAAATAAATATTAAAATTTTTTATATAAAATTTRTTILSAQADTKAPVYIAHLFDLISNKLK